MTEPESRQNAAEQADDMILGMPGLDLSPPLSDCDGHIILTALGGAIDEKLSDMLQWPLPQKILFLLEVLEAKALRIS